MGDLYLHAVTVKKPMMLSVARKMAQVYIKNTQRKFYRETPVQYIFRNLPASDFSGTFIYRKMDDWVTCVLGTLKSDATENSVSAEIFDEASEALEITTLEKDNTEEE